jgi:hypothetical protein
MAGVGLSNMVGVRYYPTWLFIVIAGVGLHYLTWLALVFIIAVVGLHYPNGLSSFYHSWCGFTLSNMV